MKTNKEYRFKDNPEEKIFHDKFKEMFEGGKGAITLAGIIFGWTNDSKHCPKQFLTYGEENICINLIQWLGSSVGQCFLDSCGYVKKEK